MTRNRLRERGASIRANLCLPRSEIEEAAGIEQFLDEAIFAEVWGRDGLALEDRLVCTIAAVSVLGRESEISQWVKAALTRGLDGPAIAEVFLQCGLYAGFGATQQAFQIAKPIFDAAGADWPQLAQQETSLEELDKASRLFADYLHGARSTSEYADPDDPLKGDLYAIVRRWGYGVIWQGVGLSQRRRMLCAVACFTVLGFEAQLRKFAASALEHNLSITELREAIMQTAPYGGFPRALAALGALSGLADDPVNATVDVTHGPIVDA